MLYSIYLTSPPRGTIDAHQEHLELFGQNLMSWILGEIFRLINSYEKLQIKSKWCTVIFFTGTFFIFAESRKISIFSKLQPSSENAFSKLDCKIPETPLGSITPSVIVLLVCFLKKSTGILDIKISIYRRLGSPYLWVITVGYELLETSPSCIFRGVKFHLERVKTQNNIKTLCTCFLDICHNYIS